MKDLTMVFLFFAFCGLCMWLHPSKAAAGDQAQLHAVAKVTGSCMLNGSASYDPNKGGRIVSYHWRKVIGGSCQIVSPDSAITAVTGLTKGVYEFSLKVVSSEGLSDTDSTNVFVKIN